MFVEKYFRLVPAGGAGAQPAHRPGNKVLK